METAQEPWIIAANHTQDGRAVGGKLVVAAGCMAFRPHGMEEALDGERVVILLADIARVGKRPGRFALSELFSGGLAARLEIRRKDGSEELFVVRNLDRVIAELERRITAAAPVGDAPG